MKNRKLSKLLPYILGISFALLFKFRTSLDISWWLVFLPLYIPIAVLVLIHGIVIPILDYFINKSKAKYVKEREALRDAHEKNPCKNC